MKRCWSIFYHSGFDLVVCQFIYVFPLTLVRCGKVSCRLLISGACPYSLLECVLCFIKLLFALKKKRRKRKVSCNQKGRSEFEFIIECMYLFKSFSHQLFPRSSWILFLVCNHSESMHKWNKLLKCSIQKRIRTPSKIIWSSTINDVWEEERT